MKKTSLLRKGEFLFNFTKTQSRGRLEEELKRKSQTDRVQNRVLEARAWREEGEGDESGNGDLEIVLLDEMVDGGF